MKKPFGSVLTLARNSRGCYILDTVKGCSVVNTRRGGCYGECYAANIAKRYRLDFGNPICRKPGGVLHMEELLKQIRRAGMPFIRIGEMGDPSENWEHTLSVVSRIKDSTDKAVVIITKHWKPIPDALLPHVQGICINTSVSALDAPGELSYRLEQFARIKEHCTSILRVVSAKFNPGNEEGQERAATQDHLFAIGGPETIDTVFRPSPENDFLTRGVVFAEKRKFLGTEMLASVHREDAYFGYCDECPDQCGTIHMPPRKPIPDLFTGTGTES